MEEKWVPSDENILSTLAMRHLDMMRPGYVLICVWTAREHLEQCRAGPFGDTHVRYRSLPIGTLTLPEHLRGKDPRFLVLAVMAVPSAKGEDELVCWTSFPCVSLPSPK